MKIVKLSLMIIFYLIIGNLLALKVHESELAGQNQPYIPDMAGFVNINTTDLSNSAFNSNERTLPSVMAGWPVSYSSANTYNGAVYTNMDTDPELEILFGVGKKIVALNIDGTAVPGWPVSLTFYIWGSPAIGDIDGDGEDDIVCTSRNNTNGNTGALYAFHKTGTAVTGFPVTQAGGGTMNACLADLNGDNVNEILLNIRNSPNGWTYVYTGNGQIMEGWPQALDTFPGAAVSAGDLNNDGSIEVVSLSYNSLYVFNPNGTLKTGFPVTFPGINYSYSSPVLYDLDGDNNKEIIFGGCGESNGAVYVLNQDGTVRTGWPKTTSSWIFATVALGDIDADGDIDILVGDQTSSSEPANYIYAWDKDGNNLTGYPAGPYHAIYCQSAIADIDGDNSTDIMFSSNLFGQGYNCINSNGTHKTGWPLPVGNEETAVTMMSTPVMADFNNDGNLEIAGASTGFTSWVVELYLWSTGVAYNQDLAYMTINSCNIKHDGLYNYSGNTNPETLTPPTNLSTVVDINDVYMYWDYEPDARDLLGFKIYRNNVLLTESPLADTCRAYTDLDLPSGQYTYKVTALYTTGESLPDSETIVVETAIDNHTDVMPSITLKGNYPNPFNPVTNIRFNIANSQSITLTVYNLKGEKVKTLFEGFKEKGEHSIVWNGKDELGNICTSGIYFYRLKTNNASISKKMLMLK